eukprot:gene14422-biopygen11518
MATKKKQFRWSTEMVECLIAAISSYKSKMEYRNLDFDGDRPAQYTQLRLLMAEKYAEKGVELFGPVAAHSISDNDIQKLNEKEKKVYYHKVKEDADLIKKGYSRIQEKVKEIRQNFSRAVVSGRRSGSGKLVFEFYDELVKIWGGTSAVEPLSSGVGTDSFSRGREVAHPSNIANAEALLDVSQDGLENDNDAESLVASDKDGDAEVELIENSRKRKPAQNEVPKLIDNKRKHLEKALSAAQRDHMLINEAKEDTKFRKELAQSMKQSSNLLSEAIKDIGSSMKQIGEGISHSMELLARAMANNQSYNQNLFYQNCPPFPNSSASVYQQNMQHGANSPHGLQRQTFQNQATVGQESFSRVFEEL